MHEIRAGNVDVVRARQFTEALGAGDIPGNPRLPCRDRSSGQMRSVIERLAAPAGLADCSPPRPGTGWHGRRPVSRGGFRELRDLTGLVPRIGLEATPIDALASLA